MKKCPFCGEEVQEEALKCRYCKEWLSKPEAPPSKTVHVQDQNKNDSTNKSSSIPATGAVRDSSNLTKWLKILLYASIVINVISLYSDNLQFQLISDMSKGVFASNPSSAISAAEVNDNRQQGISIFAFLFYVTTTILFLMWVHRVNYNAHQFGATNMRFTPGWAIGWYFVPVLTLWKPYQAMKEIWKASKNPMDWQSQSGSPILWWWWFFFVINALLGKIMMKALLKAKGIADLIWGSILSIASDIFSIPFIILTIVLVTRIYNMQMSQINKGPQYMGATSSIKRETSSSDNKGLLIGLTILGSITFIGIIAAIIIPRYMGVREQENKAQAQNEQVPAQSPTKGDIFDQIAQDQKSTPAPAPGQNDKQWLADDLGILKDRWTFVASDNDWIKRNIFYDKTSVHYPYGNKDNVRVWTKEEYITPIATGTPPVDIKYTTALVEIDCKKRTGSWLEINYIGNDGLIFSTDHKKNTQYISADTFWQHLYRGFCQ